MLAWCASAVGASASAAEPSCEQFFDARTFHQRVSEGDSAYAEMDLQAFQAARLGAREMVPCLAEPLSPAQVAGFHRIEALGAFLARDHAGAVASLRSLMAAAPGYQLSSELAPDGHPLRLYFNIAENALVLPGSPVAARPDGWTMVDGSTSAEWPIDRPYLYQEFDPSGGVRMSTVRASGVAPPGFTAEPDAAVRSSTAGTKTARTLGFISAGSAVVAGGLYLGARASAGQFWDPATSAEELDSLRRRTNTFGALSAGVGFVAVGTGGAALFVGTW
jgi:hypothetical protein